MIKDNIYEVRNKISNIEKQYNIAPDKVTLIAVSKTKPVDMLMEAYDCGIRDFGENKVQEILDKYDQMPKDINWHMIGHLQSNKVKYIIDKVAMIHSVDSLKLAEIISKESVKKDIIMPILLEVNVAGEESKYGFLTAELMEAYQSIIKLPGVCVKGLMTVAPFVENAEDNRCHFITLRELSVDISSKNADNRYDRQLSMGMTGDYEVAISEGSTFIRVGTGIFGERNYSV